MKKPWLILVLIAGGASVTTLAVRYGTPASGSASFPTAAVIAFASSSADTTYPDRRSIAVSPPSPKIEDRVAGLLAAIWRELNSTHKEDHETVFTKLLPELIALDPEAAAKLVEAATLEQGREELLRQLIQTWTLRDVTSAFTWAGQLSDANEQERAMLYAIKQMAERDPAAAAATAALFLEDGQGDVMKDIALTWALQDLAGALNWAASRPAGEQRDEIMARVTFVESRTAPEAAANRVTEEIPPGLVQEDAIISVLHQWALKDFPSARTWTNRFPSGPFLERALKELSGIASGASGGAN